MVLSRVDNNFYKWIMQQRQEQNKSVRQITQAIADNGIYVQAVINNSDARKAVEKILRGK